MHRTYVPHVNCGASSIINTIAKIDGFAYRGEFCCDQWISRRWRPELDIPWVEPRDMLPRELLVPQLVDEVSADIIPVDVEIPDSSCLNDPARRGKC